MKKIYITEEERVKCRKVMEAFSEMYEEQDVLVVDAGNYGFIKLQWFNEKQGFEAAIPYSDSRSCLIHYGKHGLIIMYLYPYLAHRLQSWIMRTYSKHSPRKGRRN